MAKTFSDNAFDPVALIGLPYMFLGDYQTESRLSRAIGAGQNQNLLGRDLECGGVKNPLEVSGG